MADRIVEWASWLTSNPFTKALAALIAITAWLFVQQDVAEEATIPVRLRYVVSEGMAPVEPVRNQVLLRVEGPRAATKRVRAAGVDRSIDLAGLPVGEHIVDLSALDWALVPSVDVIAVEPPTLDVELDEIVLQKVEVVPRTIGEPDVGYDLGQITVDPSVVELEGPRKVVVPLTRVETKAIDVTALSALTTVDAPLDLPRWVRVSDGTIPRATIDVEVVTATLADLSVPVVVYDAPGWAPDPRRLTVSLKGPRTVLEWIDDDSVVAVVRLPAGARSALDARYGAKRGARVEVLHPGGPAVEITKVSPELVHVERR